MYICMGVSSTRICLITTGWLDLLLFNEGICLSTCSHIPGWLYGQKWACVWDLQAFLHHTSLWNCTDGKVYKGGRSGGVGGTCTPHTSTLEGLYFRDALCALYYIVLYSSPPPPTLNLCSCAPPTRRSYSPPRHKNNFLGFLSQQFALMKPVQPNQNLGPILLCLFLGWLRKTYIRLLANVHLACWSMYRLSTPPSTYLLELTLMSWLIYRIEPQVKINQSLVPLAGVSKAFCWYFLQLYVHSSCTAWSLVFGI